jgi:hypothetical protein
MVIVNYITKMENFERRVYIKTEKEAVNGNSITRTENFGRRGFI